MMAITESHVGMKWSVIDVLSSNNNYIMMIWILGEIGGRLLFLHPILQCEAGFDELSCRSLQIYFVKEFAQRYEGRALWRRQLSRAFECHAARVKAALKMDWMIHKGAVVILRLTMLHKSKFSSRSKIKQTNSIQ
jgi:hypothetical protein